jgi:signal peptidase I
MRIKQNNFWQAVWEWVESFLIALVIALAIRTFVVQAFKIPTSSMFPTLRAGDRILVNKLFYGPRIPFTKIRLPSLQEPQRGDIIVFIYPEDPKKDFIKRLIAFGGEKVEIKNGSIYIDGQITAESRLQHLYYYNRGEYGEEGQVITVPEGCYYVLGDNSASSRDSRYWGFVPKDNLLGKAMVIYWPLNRMRITK